MVKMAVKRTKTVVMPEEPTREQSEPIKRKNIRVPKWLIWVVAAIAVLCGFWYKTNTWPVVAMVGWRPVTRFEINQALFAQGGNAQVENRITEIRVGEELAKLGVKVTDDEVEAKINEIKTGLGEGVDMEQILLSKGMTMNDYKRQLKLLMGAEKAVSDKITVTDDEVNQALKSMGGSATSEADLANARENVRLYKLDAEIATWVSGLEEKYKVWKMPGLFPETVEVNSGVTSQ
jgi:hypothetical protein